MDKTLEKKVSIGGNLWQIADIEDRFVELIVQRYNIPYIVAKIIALRGVSINDVEVFLNSKISNTMPDPYVLKDMRKAAERIASAIVNKQRISIIGDYDVDGAT